MLKPQTNTNNQESSLPLEGFYISLTALIDNNIEQFPPFLGEATRESKSIGEIKKDKFEQEDDITLRFGRFFRYLGSEFDFESQSKTPEANATTDIGIIVPRFCKHRVICFVEAKRLPTPKDTKREETEYVYYKSTSKQGGIERFKTEKHAGQEKLNFSIMLGYIQEQTHSYWHTEVNKWIESQINTSSNSEINWANQDKLIHDTTFTKANITKYNSTHSRKNLKDIEMLHYWIDVN